jgi:hypothetical protein
MALTCHTNILIIVTSLPACGLRYWLCHDDTTKPSPRHIVVFLPQASTALNMHAVHITQGMVKPAPEHPLALRLWRHQNVQRLWTVTPTHRHPNKQ